MDVAKLNAAVRYKQMNRPAVAANRSAVAAKLPANPLVVAPFPIAVVKSQPASQPVVARCRVTVAATAVAIVAVHLAAHLAVVDVRWMDVAWANATWAIPINYSENTTG